MKFNYQSEFDFTISSTGGEASLLEIDFDAYAHIIDKPYPRVGFGRRNGTLYDCFDDAGKVHVVCDKHGFSPGDLVVEIFLHVPNQIYPDREQTRHSTIRTDIELVEGKGDEGTTAEIEAIIPYAIVTDYEIAKRHGYSGTQEEYTKSIDELPDCVEAAKHQPQVINHTWWTWDVDAKSYRDTGESAGSGVMIEQSTGQSETSVMSQKATTNSLNERLKRIDFSSSACTFNQFKDWLTNATAGTGQPSCFGIVKFEKNQNPIFVYNLVLQCFFVWLSDKQDGTSASVGTLRLWPADYTSSIWGITQRTANTWKPLVKFYGDIDSAQHTWSASNNFIGGLKKNGVDVATVNDVSQAITELRNSLQ